MSSIDERVVKMVFDNSQFGNKINSTIDSLNKLNKTTEEVGKNSGNGGISKIGEALEKTEITATRAGFHIQDVWLKVASIFEYQIAGKIVDAGKKIANALTIEGVTDGFREYELKMGSIQTIMAGTGESLATVNQYLDELNTYSDKTIYSFADMTNNIGKFTNAGVKLNDAVAAIKGVANEAAISGANANEASRAMYNFSQALSAGFVKLIDWKSIENANMATKGFKNTLLEVAAAVGNVEKTSDGMYKVLTTNSKGGTMDEAISETKNFNDSLNYQWMTTEVLTKALKIYATDVRDLTEEEKRAYEEELKALGMTDEQIKHFEELGIKATDAASEIKTFSMLMDTLKEAIGSGWAMTWQYIIGDFEQAKALWTEVGNVMSDAINGMSDARNNLIKGALQTGWEQLTTIPERAIPNSEKYRDVLLQIAVAHGKLTQEQADGIDSTDKLVKSFHELNWATGDLLKESVESYYRSLLKLSDEEKKEAGLQDSDIERLGKLSRELQTGSIDADRLAESMNKLGGRENVIEGLRNTFKGLASVIKPISEAFREIFPPMTVKQLYAMTEGFKEFSKQLIVTGETADKIKRTAKGLFSIFDIVGKTIGAVVKGLMPAVDGLGSFSSKLLDTSATVGDFFTNLDRSLTDDNVFEKITESISDFLNVVGEKASKVGDFFKPIYDSIKEFVNVEGIGDSIKEFAKDLTKCTGPIEVFSSIFSFLSTEISAAAENLKAKFDFLIPLFEGVASVLKGAAKVIGDVLKGIGESISGFASGDEGAGSRIANVLNAVFAGGALYKIFGNVKSLSSVCEIIEMLGDTLQAFQKKLAAEALLNIAKAVGIMAASLFLLATLDTNRLMAGVGVIGALLTELSLAMAGLMKAINSFSTTNVKKTFSIFGKDIFGIDAGKMIEMTVTLGAVSKALLAMAGSVLMLAIALKMIASVAEGGHLWDSFLVLTLMLGELTVVSIALSKYSSKSNKGVANLKGMATSLIGLSIALAIVAKVVEGGNAWEALGILSIMLVELGGIAILMEKFGQYKLGGMGGLISMAIAINLLVFALKETAEAIRDYGDLIGQALLVITAILGELTLVMLLMSEVGAGAALGGLGALMAAAAILIFVQAIKQISDALGETDQHVWQALGVIAVSLITLAAGMTAMVAALPGAAALLIASVALIALGAALKVLASMELSEIGKALLALAGSLAILAVGLTGMLLALPGAAALVVAAAGLMLLVGVLKILASMDIAEIGKSLLALFAALGGLALISTLLSVVSPLMIAFGVAITALGVGLLAAGAGLVVFSSGLQALVAILPLGSVALKQLVEVIMELLPVIVEGVMDALATLCEKIVAYSPNFIAAAIAIISGIAIAITVTAPLIAQAATAVLRGLIDVVIDSIQHLCERVIEIAPTITDTILTVLNEIARMLIEWSPVAVQTVFTLLMDVLNGIAEYSDDITKAVYDMLIGILNGITEKIPEIAAAGTDMMIAFMTAISTEIPRITQAAYDCAIALINGLADTIDNNNEELITAVQHLLDVVMEAIQQWLTELTPLGLLVPKNMGDGVKDGEDDEGSFGKVIQNMIDTVLKGLKDKVDDFKTAAKNLIGGFLKGLREKADDAYEQAKSFGGRIYNAFARSREGLDEHSPSKKTVQAAKYFVQGWVDTINNLAPNAIKGAATLGGKLSEALQSAVDTAGEIADGSMNLSPVITPVLDLDNLKDAATDISGIVDISKPLSVARSTSVLFNKAESTPTIDPNSNENVVKAINKLSDNMHDTLNSMKNMQVVMDSGTLVGELTAPMDSALGRNMSYKQRGM